MSEIITPSVAARLRFFVTDPTTGVGVTGLTHSTITTAGYATEANGVRSSTTSVTLTSTAAATAALATGQVVEYGLGQYAIDVPAVGTSGLIFAVVTVTGNDVRAVRHSIDVAVSSRLAPAVSGRTLNVNTSGEGDAVLNTATQGQIDAMTRGLIAGVVGSSSSTTVVNVTSTESGLAVTDQLKGRVIIFNKDTTTAALRGQGAPIDTNDTTSITVASGDAFTTAPASGDTFTIY